MARVDARSEVDQAFAQLGFSQDLELLPRIVYRGSLVVGSARIDASCEISDFEFVRYPRIVISKEASRRLGVLAHVERDGNVCYFERGSQVLDRYRPGGSLLRCILAAQETLERSVKGVADHEIAEEFHGYWSSAKIAVDFSPSFRGETAKLLALQLTTEAGEFYLLTDQKEPNSVLLKRHQAQTNRSAVPVAECHLAYTEKRLTVHSGTKAWPPETLDAFRHWLDEYLGDSRVFLRRLFAGTGQGVWWLALVAPNGALVARLVLPLAYQKREFLEQRRANLLETVEAGRIAIKLERYIGAPIDSQYVFSRNLGKLKNLEGKKIALLGCGTIGGFLAQYLALSGAGQGKKGSLLLVDDDVLASANLGRHILSAGWLDSQKATACAELLESTIQGIRVEAFVGDARQKFRALMQFDVVIDATGEEALSLSLNAFALENRPTFPPVLHVWVAANGGAVQAMMVDDPRFACLKCLKPDPDATPRFKVSKKDVNLVRSVSCADSSFVPFPVTSSVHAAALGAQMVIEWMTGRKRDRFRTLTLDPEQAFKAKDQNVTRAKGCPACGG